MSMEMLHKYFYDRMVKNPFVYVKICMKQRLLYDLNN